MSIQLLILADLIAIVVLTFGLYFPRHRRRDMVVAILGINVGVLAVAITFSRSAITAGLGLGLFGVLSIIRLRSEELGQEEVAYYFSALALGLIGGISVSPAWVAPTLMAVIVASMFIGDHPLLLADHRRQRITLDGVYADEVSVRERLEELLGPVERVRITRVNIAGGTTSVDVVHKPKAASGFSRSRARDPESTSND